MERFARAGRTARDRPISLTCWLRRASDSYSSALQHPEQWNWTSQMYGPTLSN